MFASFSHLLPETVLDSVKRQGFIPTGAFTPLNSYENRVYEIALEDHPPVIAKYYRPGRWSLPAIIDEHRFIARLCTAELPVVAPLPLRDSLPDIATLCRQDEFFYALYPKFRGRENADLTLDHRKQLGRLLARLHNIGACFPADHRPILDPDSYGYAHFDTILSQAFLPEDLRKTIDLLLNHALRLLEPVFTDDIEIIALHGDCHLGNILWNADGPHLVDFDDMVVAPAIQDLWMLLNGTPDEMARQRDAFLEGYAVFRHFDERTFILVEPLRTLRMIHYCAWIGNRYNDPSFQTAFPYYRERRYWETFSLHLKEQISLLQEL